MYRDYCIASLKMAEQEVRHSDYRIQATMKCYRV